jgi:uncharacterized lipoprotein YajG
MLPMSRTAAAFNLNARSALLRLLVVLAVLILPGASAFADTTVTRPPAPSEELNTVLMHATFWMRDNENQPVRIFVTCEGLNAPVSTRSFEGWSGWTTRH